MSALHGLLGSLIDLGASGFLARIVKPAVGPVAVGAENSGPLAIRGLTPRARRFGSVEIARDIMSRIARKEDFFDGIVIAVDLAVNDRREGKLRRPCQEAR